MNTDMIQIYSSVLSIYIKGVPVPPIGKYVLHYTLLYQLSFHSTLL